MNYKNQMLMKKIKREINLISSFIKNVLKHTWSAIAHPYRLKRLRNFLFRFNQFLSKEIGQYPHPQSPEVEKMKEKAKELHQLLPKSELYSFSIIIPVYKPKARYFKMALESALSQSSAKMEILVGFDGPQPEDVYTVFEELEKKHPQILKGFQLDRDYEGGNISSSTNSIVKHAKGNFLLLMDHDDWIRPDLLLYYEKKLRSLQKPENAVLYCDEYKIDEHDHPIPFTGLKKPLKPSFPYLFNNWICHCLLIPKTLWNTVKGLRNECNGAQDYDISLRLDLAKADFFNVPIFLYAWRSHEQSTAKNPNQKEYVHKSALRALKDYFQNKKLNWDVEVGYFSTVYKAIPSLKSVPKVQIIREHDFNDHYDSDLLLFLNSAIELAPDALQEMCRWIDQPHIGAVGCRINYPDGKLLHGGIDIRASDHPASGIKWEYSEQGRDFHSLDKGRQIRTVDAITKDCLLIKTKTFFEIKELSQTSKNHFEMELGMKLKEKGLFCLYTPYAVGTKLKQDG